MKLNAISAYCASKLTTLQTKSEIAQVIFLSSKQQLVALSEMIKNRCYLILGEGSNTLFIENFLGTVVVNQLKGVEVLNSSPKNNTVMVKVAAGENWHDFVCLMQEKKFYGLENLALIPGTVGASPVQNIGAYGVEVCEFIETVEVFDFKDNTIKNLSNQQCQFSYRESLFKQTENLGRYLVTAVTFKLLRVFLPKLNYAELKQLPENTTSKALINKVIEVRQSKLPDVNTLANAGSFFKNPVVSSTIFEKIKKQFIDVVGFELSDGQVKISAAWLIEKAGFKGCKRSNGAGVYEHHALILVNRGGATGKDIIALVNDIRHCVKQQFNIGLQPEVRLIEQSGVKQH